MFGMLRSQSRSASGAIKYVTIGVLMMIWAGLWYYYFLRPDPNPPAWQNFVCIGVIMSGFAIMSIGLLFGLIGRGAKTADTTVGVASPVVMPGGELGTPAAVPSAVPVAPAAVLPR